MTERSKLRSIQKLYNKELRQEKDTKNYKVTRAFKAVKNPKTHGKKVTFVDKRQKKDKRAAKRILREQNGKGKVGKGKGKGKAGKGKKTAKAGGGKGKKAGGKRMGKN